MYTKTSRLRTLAAFLAVTCIALGVFATSAFAATITTGLDFTDPATADTGSGYVWDSATKTLTLNGFQQSVEDTSGIVLPDGAKVLLVGKDNSITMNQTTSSSDPLSVIVGRGSVEFNRAGSTSGSVGLSIIGRAASGVTSPKITGVTAAAAVVVTDANIDIDTAASISGARCSGVLASSFTSTRATITVVGSKADRSSWGIEAQEGGAIQVTDSSLTLTADYGIGDGSFTALRSRIVIDALNTGLVAQSITATKSSLTVTSDSPSSSGYAIAAYGNVTFTDCDLSASAKRGLLPVGLLIEEGTVNFIRTNATLEGTAAGLAVLQTGVKPATPAPIRISDGYTILEGGTIAYYLAESDGTQGSIWSVSPSGSFTVDPSTFAVTGAATKVVIGPVSDSGGGGGSDEESRTPEPPKTDTGSGDVKTGDMATWPCAALATGALVVMYFAGIRRFLRS